MAALLGVGCGGFALSSKQQSVVQPDLRLPRGTRIAVVPLTLYGYGKDQRLAASNNAYSGVVSALLRAGFHVVERTLVEKAVQDYAHGKEYNKTVGAQGAVYQDTGPNEEEKVVDLVDIGRTLNARLVAAGSMELTSGMLESRVEARLRVTDVTNGEMVSHCEGGGNPKVMEACANAMATELSAHILGGFALPLPTLPAFPALKTQGPSSPQEPPAQTPPGPTVGEQLGKLQRGDKVRITLRDSTSVEGTVVDYHSSLLWLTTPAGKIWKQTRDILAVETLAK